MSQEIKILLPVGRIVGGSLYKGQDKDAEGHPLVVKTGPNAGQARVRYYVGYAIPKGQETHWNQTPWGAQIWNVRKDQNKRFHRLHWREGEKRLWHRDINH